MNIGIDNTCVCGGTEFSEDVIKGITILTCNSCRIKRRKVDDVKIDYMEEYFKSIYSHNYIEDRRTAISRINRYGAYLAGNILDFGCGNCAFVDEASLRGLEIVGTDLKKEGTNKFYSGSLIDIGFPTNSFDTITAHDVLEHIEDFNGTVKELLRILKSEGTLIIDHPDFGTTDRHYKLEHIWCFTGTQLKNILEEKGFVIVQDYVPVQGKRTFICKAPRKPKSTTILVPPGIGDSYWVICKLESFIKKHNISIPDVYISSTRKDRDRANDFVKRFSFLNCCGYHEHLINKDPIWHTAYMQDGVGEFRNVLGFDYFLSANGPFRFDKRLEDIMPQYEVNWYPKMFVSLREKKFGLECKQRFKKYIVAFFTDHGTYQHWIKAMGADRIYKMLKQINEKTGCKIILSGASWDINNINGMLTRLGERDGFLINLINQTTLEEFFGLMRYSSGCVGYPGGNTIFATYLKKPTIILWHKYYNRRFWDYSCPPDSLNNWYVPVDVEQVKEDVISEWFKLKVEL